MSIIQEIKLAEKTAKCKTIKSKYNELTISELADAFIEIEKQDLSVISVVMNSKTFSSNIRKRTREDFNNCIDFITESKLIKKGICAIIWGVNVIVNANIPDNVIYLLSEKRNTIPVTVVAIKLSTVVTKQSDIDKLIVTIKHDLKIVNNNFARLQILLQK